MFHGKALHVQHLCDAPDEPKPNKTKVPFPPLRASDARARRRRRVQACARDAPCASAAGTFPKGRARSARRTICACSSAIASALFARITRPWRGAVRSVSKSFDSSARDPGGRRAGGKSPPPPFIHGALAHVTARGEH